MSVLRDAGDDAKGDQKGYRGGFKGNIHLYYYQSNEIPDVVCQSICRNVILWFAK